MDFDLLRVISAFVITSKNFFTFWSCSDCVHPAIVMSSILGKAPHKFSFSIILSMAFWNAVVLFLTPNGILQNRNKQPFASKAVYFLSDTWW